jgi:hypothetical protein
VLEREPGEWCIWFRRQFGLTGAIEWDNMCREVRALPTDLEEDIVSCALDPSRIFSTNLVYLRLLQGGDSDVI